MPTLLSDLLRWHIVARVSRVRELQHRKVVVERPTVVQALGPRRAAFPRRGGVRPATATAAWVTPGA